MKKVSEHGNGSSSPMDRRSFLGVAAVAAAGARTVPGARAAPPPRATNLQAAPAIKGYVKQVSKAYATPLPPTHASWARAAPLSPQRTRAKS